MDTTNSANGLRSISLALAVAAALAAGCSGGNGAAGKDGTSCALTDNHDGTATIHCADGTSFTVASGTNGTNGTNGTQRNERHERRRRHGLHAHRRRRRHAHAHLRRRRGRDHRHRCGRRLRDDDGRREGPGRDGRRHHRRQLPRRRAAGREDQGQRTARPGREEPVRDRGELAVRAAEAGPGHARHRARRERQRQRHLGQLPRRQRSLVGLHRDRGRREPDRSRRRQLRLPLRQGDQRRADRRRHDVRGRQGPPPHHPALCVGEPVLAHQPGQGAGARDRRRRHRTERQGRRQRLPRVPHLVPRHQRRHRRIRRGRVPQRRPLRRPHLRRLPQRSEAFHQHRHAAHRAHHRGRRNLDGQRRRPQPRGGPQPAGLHPQDSHGQQAEDDRRNLRGSPPAVRDDLPAGRPQLHQVPPRARAARRSTGRPSRPAGPAAPVTTTAASRRRPRRPRSRTAAGRRRPTSGCSTCHQAGSVGGDIAAKHTPVSNPNPAQHLSRARPATATPTPPTSRRRAPSRRAPRW